MRQIVIAAASSGSFAWVRLACACGVVLLSSATSSACKVSVPSGVFSCAHGERCPPGQACGADEICRTGDEQSGDASPPESDSGPDSSDADLEAGTTHDSGETVEAGNRNPSGSGGRSGAGAGGSGGGSGGSGGGVGAAAGGGSGDGAGVAAGGGSGGGAGSSGDGSVGQQNEPGFRVLSVTPAVDNPVLDDLAAGLKVTFSAPVEEDSVRDASFAITRDGLAVSGMRSVAGSEARFQAAPSWALATDYDLQLTAAIHDREGHALAPFALSFRTRDGQWQREKRADGTGVQIAGAGDGYAVIAWSQPGTMYPEIWSSQFTPPGTWSAPVQVKETNAGAFLDRLAVNRRHRAAMSWSSISSNVNVSAYTTGPSWGMDAYISQTSYNSRLILNEQDELFIVCDQPDFTGGGSGYAIRGARYTLGNTSPTILDIGPSSGDDTRPGIALLDGDPRVIWQHAASGSTTPTQIVSGGLNSGTGTPVSANGVSAANAVLAGDPQQASIIVAWEQSDPSWTNAWAARMVIGSSWSAPERISDDKSSVQNIALALDPTGRALAAWRQAGGIVAARFVPGMGWLAPERISVAASTNADAPHVALDPSGNGIVAWTQDGMNASLNEVWVARYLRSGGFKAEGRIRVSDLEAGTGDVIGLVGDDYGRALVTWFQANQVWIARFD